MKVEEFKPFEGNISFWRRYIAFVRTRTHEEICFVYERALIANCDNPELWLEYFEYLDFEHGNSQRALELLRTIPHFFKGLDTRLEYTWIEL